MVGGKNDSILLFTFNDLSNYFSEEELGPEFEFLPHKMDSLIEANPGMIAIFSKNISIKIISLKLQQSIISP